MHVYVCDVCASINQRKIMTLEFIILIYDSLFLFWMSWIILSPEFITYGLGTPTFFSLGVNLASVETGAFLMYLLLQKWHGGVARIASFYVSGEDRHVEICPSQEKRHLVCLVP